MSRHHLISALALAALIFSPLAVRAGDTRVKGPKPVHIS